MNANSDQTSSGGSQAMLQLISTELVSKINDACVLLGESATRWHNAITKLWLETRGYRRTLGEGELETLIELFKSKAKDRNLGSPIFVRKCPKDREKIIAKFYQPDTAYTISLNGRDPEFGMATIAAIKHDVENNGRKPRKRKGEMLAASRIVSAEASNPLKPHLEDYQKRLNTLERINGANADTKHFREALKMYRAFPNSQPSNVGQTHALHCFDTLLKLWNIVVSSTRMNASVSIQGRNPRNYKRQANRIADSDVGPRFAPVASVGVYRKPTKSSFGTPVEIPPEDPAEEAKNFSILPKSTVISDEFFPPAAKQPAIVSKDLANGAPPLKRQKIPHEAMIEELEKETAGVPPIIDVNLSHGALVKTKKIKTNSYHNSTKATVSRMVSVEQVNPVESRTSDLAPIDKQARKPPSTTPSSVKDPPRFSQNVNFLSGQGGDDDVPKETEGVVLKELPSDTKPLLTELSRKLESAVTANDAATAVILCQNNEDDKETRSLKALDTDDLIVAVIASMQHFGEHALVQEKGCFALWSFANNNQENKACIASGGGIETIVTGMKRHTSCASLQVQACGVLCTLAYGNNEHRVDVATAGGIDAIVSAMNAHIKSAPVQENACYALWILAVHDENKKAIARAGGVVAVVSAMKNNQRISSVQAQACGALSTLAYNNLENQNQIAKHGGILAVVAAMNLHKESEQVQTQACEALWNVSHNNGENQVAIEGAGGIVAIVASMNQFEASVSVQENACGALRALMPSDYNKSAVIRAGGTGTIVTAMKHYPNLVSINENGCDALLALCLSHKKPLSEIVDTGGIEVVVDAMKHHTESTSLQENACKLLRKVSDTCDNGKAILRAGGGDVLISTIRIHQKTSSVVEQACGTLSNVAKDDENRLVIATVETIVAVTSAMNYHPDSESFQQTACEAIKNFCNSSNQRDIASAGGIVSVLTAMQRHWSSPTVQQSATGAIVNLSQDEDNRIAIAQSGGITALVDALKFNRDHVNVQETACNGLGNLALTEANKMKVIKAGGCSVLVKTMCLHQGNSSIQEAACRALQIIASCKDAHVAITEAGGISAAVNAMKRHAQSSLVQKHACDLLSCLTSSEVSGAAISQAGGIVSAVAAMNSHNEPAGTVQQSSCRFLSNRALSGEGRDEIAKADGVIAIIDAMKCHETCESLQEVACQALYRLSNSTNCLKMIRALMDPGLLEAAISRFPFQCKENATSVLELIRQDAQ